MSQYKVPQNVEAEDKIIGPLTLKQFIYAIVGVAWAGVSFAIFHAVIPLVIIIAAPVTLLFMLLAFYQRDGQDFEQLLIAMVGYFSQSRQRIWRKDEVVDSFRIQANAVVVEQTQRNPLEVRSELERLGTMIDSRGWNAPVSDTQIIQPAVISDRLVEPAETSPHEDDEGQATDMLDLQKSPLAQNLATLIQEAAVDIRQEAIDQMKTTPATNTTPTVKPISTSVTTANSNDILKLATERDDLTVSQLAASATRIAPLQEGQSVELRSNGTNEK
jgi:hypothetical protein